MKITVDRLIAAHACAEQRDRFATLYPGGLEPTIENLVALASVKLDVWWLWHLLPAEGPGSQRAYALWCAEQVAHLCSDARAEQYLQIVRREVDAPDSVSDEEWAAAKDAAKDAAWTAAWTAAKDATWTAAWTAARAAAWAAAWAAAKDAAWTAAWTAAWAAAKAAQLACLSQLLTEAK